VSGKPRLLVLSHVHPFPGSSGQQQRVRYTLEAARPLFDVTFVTCAPSDHEEKVRAGLASFVDASVVLPARYARTPAARWRHRAGGILHALATGEKRTNYDVGSVEFPPERIASAVRVEDYDVALFEYWYAVGTAAVFRKASVPCILDMHNILWKAYERQLSADRWMPAPLRRFAVSRYRAREEASWRAFDGLVAINREEERYVRARGLSPEARVFYAPMGVDLSRWSRRWQPQRPPRVGFYGGLGSAENEEGALRCHRVVMPRVWRETPDAELWLVGSHPSSRLTALTADPRVKVTGFVRDVAEVLSTMSCVVCPWSGTYGFRSRLVEVMSLGVPTVASREAVWGMELEEGGGVLLADGDDSLARFVVDLLGDETRSRELGEKGRVRVETLFTVDATYGRWMRAVREWLDARGARVP
jgi:glycosyltransferase involved in cell wall biosynthesis